MPQFDMTGDYPTIGITDFQLFLTAPEKYIDIHQLGLPIEGCLLDISEFIEGCAFCVRGACLHCQEGWQYAEQVQRCSPICGDFKLVENEQCDDGNEIPYDGCFQCQFSCDQNCINCQMGICYECQFGYYINLLDKSCFSICGDGIVASNESCDEGNMIFQSRCQNCQIQCQKECLSCISGQCYSCKGLGWEIDLVSRECKSNCGDNIIVGNEQCDHGNELDQDGCFQCQSICELGCTKCLDRVCLECQIKDGIVVGNEKCDDGNLIPFDGCFECQFDCQSECTDCQSGLCQACELLGWQLINHRCHSICGDGFIVDGQEECDDGNDQANDGCYQCKFQCSDGCVECQQDKCLKCDNLYLLDTQTSKCILIHINDDEQDIDLSCLQCNQLANFRCGENQLLIDYKCVNQCGNGLFNNQYEACDDGNFYGGDGCSSFCNIEDSYQCDIEQGSQSLCTYIQAPEFYLNILSGKTNSTQTVE
ncbi:unnamed protein product [Paramecium pentaurelia]|uniref:Uncharacterized protein n=1 Tax=Paramecium pentaurelia TaxID=43138 RepID=A0A8S1X1S0_9CILI|nr:unnamed protein product [Paramecium pentaurelia]